MPTPEETKQRAAFIFDAAADNFDHSALHFWDHFGRKTVRNYLCKSAREFWTFVAVRAHRRFPQPK
jgi:hypothetical protein